MPRDVMNAKQLAEYLGIAESTVYKKVEYREIPFTKVGSLLRFPRWLIDEWLTKRAVHPIDGLFEEFIALKQRYHLEQWLKAQGLVLERLTEAQLVDSLQAAIHKLKVDLADEGP